jgi:hypothetical protein
MEAKEAKENTQSKSAKSFLITINNVPTYEKVHNYLLGLKTLNYYIATREIAPTTNHVHIHIYCQFTNSVRLSLRKLMGAHIDKCYGSPQQNLDYIYKVKEPEKKGEIFDEWGEIRLKGGSTIKDVEEMNKEERKNLPIQYYKIVKAIELEEKNDLGLDDLDRKKINVLYISGESGYGKTGIAKRLIRRYLEANGQTKWNSIKREGEFWHGVSENAKVALYDDFRDSHMKPSEFINLVDYNSHTMNVKGGSVLNKYEFIIITSVQDLMSIYYDYCQNNSDEPSKQWMRRVKTVKLTEEIKPEEYDHFINNKINILFN